MSLHPTMAAALAPFAPASSEVHQIAALPGLEVSEATHADFVDSMAGDLELVPIERDSMNRMLERAEMRMSDATYHALRNEVNGGAA